MWEPLQEGFESSDSATIQGPALMIKILHDLTYRNAGNYGSRVYVSVMQEFYHQQ